MEPTEYAYNFVVAGLSEADCTELLDAIIAFVEQKGGTLGGGFGPCQDDEAEAGDGEEVA